MLYGVPADHTGGFKIVVQTPTLIMFEQQLFVLTLVTKCGYPKPNTQCIEISVQSFMCAMKIMCKHSLVEPRTKVDAQRNTLAQAHKV